MGYDVFISYRRDGGDTLAQLIYDRLTARGYRVFLDIESLRSGKFNEKLLSLIEECQDFVVILPPHALDRCTFEDGSVNEEDWLYQELSHGMKCKKNIVPVMMKGFSWPETLPEGLEGVSNYNGIQDSKDYFDAVIDKICSLLHSKPDTLGLAVKKLKKHVQKLTPKKERKFGKKQVFISLLIILALLSIPAFFTYQRKQKDAQLASITSIRLTAPDEISVSEYDDALKLLQKRIEILSDGKEYAFETDGETSWLDIPIEVFPDGKVSDILRSYVTRPVNLSLLDYDSNTNLKIERSDIVSIKTEEGTLDCIDFERYPIDSTDSYYYSTITFTDDFWECVRETFGNNMDGLYLAHDYKQFSTHFYYYDLTYDGTAGTMYFVDTDQQKNILNLMEFDYTNEPFPDAFSFNILMPAQWENTSDAEFAGTYQCNLDELNGNLVTLQYTFNADESLPEPMTKGAYEDSIRVFKNRLDALGQPYAFGFTVNDPYGFTIRTNCERMGDDIAYMLCGKSLDFSIGNPYFSDSSYQNVQLVENDNSSALTFNFYAHDMENTVTEMFQEMQKTGESNFYLYFNDVPIGICDWIDSSTTKVPASVTFDNLFRFGISNKDPKHPYLMDFLYTVIGGTDFPEFENYQEYSFSTAHYSRESDSDTQAGIVSVREQEIYDQLYPKLSASYPDVTLTLLDYYAYIDLNLNDMEHVLEDFSDAIINIAEIMKPYHMEYQPMIRLYYPDNHSARFSYYYSAYDKGFSCASYFNGATFQDESKQWAELMKTDPYYLEYFVNAADWISWNEN